MMTKIVDAYFEDMLKVAVTDLFLDEMKSTPTSEFNPSDAFKNKMKKLFKEDKKNDFLKKFSKMGKRVAMYFLILIGIISTILIFNENVRAGLYNMIVEWFDDHAWIKYEQIKGMEEVEFDMNSIPEEYIVENYEDFYGIVRMELYDEDENLIRFSIIPPSASSAIGTDNEHHKIEHIEFGYIYAIKITKEREDGLNSLIWREKSGYLYHLSSENVSSDRLVKLAKKIFEK